MENDALIIARIFGKVMARVTWKKMFKRHLKGIKWDSPFFSKSDAIESIIMKNKDDQQELMSFFQLLFNEHRGVTIQNLTKINEHLKSFGFTVDKDCIIYLVNREESFLTEVDNLLNELSEKIGDGLSATDKKRNLDTLYHHLSLAQKHFDNKDWDDMSSQLRKALEFLISLLAKLKLTPFPKSVNGKLNSLVEANTISGKEKELVYSLYGLLSERGAHPGISDLDESLLRYRITIEIARYLVKLI